VDAFARGLEKADLARSGFVGDVENLKAALKLQFGLEPFVVDQHHVAGDSHLVRVNAHGHFEVGDEFGMFRVAHVDDRRPVRRLHVADVGVAVLDGD